MTVANEEPSADDERTARAHMALSMLAIGLMGLALYLGYELTRPADAAPGRSCTEANKEETCEGDEDCVDGQCRESPERRRQQRCQENDPCGECVCTGKFMCDPEGVCRPREADSCSPALIAALQDTRRFEREQCKSHGKQASTCEPKDLEKFFIKHEDYDALLAALEHRATVHFDNSQPSNGVLTRDVEGQYVRALTGVARRYLDAKHILVIGRASPDGTHSQSSNYSLAQQRMLLVQKWLIGLADTPQGRDEMSKKLITLAIGTTHQLDAKTLAEDEYHRFITSREGGGRQLREQLARHTKLPRNKRSELDRFINQSVLVVPIPCEIPDDPAPAAAQP